MKIRSLSLGPVFFVLTVGVAPCMGEVNEVDNNFDGKIDTWQYVNAQGKLRKPNTMKTLTVRWIG